MRIAVIGGGLFGATAAVHAARAGHDVHLYEVKSDLMCGATASTYSRLHRGAHYPRSAETGRESRRAEQSFRAEYGSAVIDGGRQFYHVPREGSKVNIDRYRQFLDNEGLAFTEEDGWFAVTEPRVNLSALSALVRQKVKDAGVTVHLNTPAPANLRDRFDRIVVAAYSGINSVLCDLGLTPSTYKFQVVEKPVAFLPSEFRDTSIVVIDGPFGCLDPLDDTPLHVLGHVTETIHAGNVGMGAQVPNHLMASIDAGLIRNPQFTKFDKVVQGLSMYIPGVEKAIHVGSMFTVRALLANVEDTDARPTMVHKIDDQVYKIFSGKIGTSCAAARELCNALSVNSRKAA